MYCINGTDPVFDTLLTENDRYCFNLFYRIREDTGAYIATDGSTCILAQSNLYTPVWIWLKNSPDEKSALKFPPSSGNVFPSAAGYPPSNAVYRKIGYVKQGKITEQEIFRKG